MFIKFNYDDSFEELILKLTDKYPKEFLKINGISDEYLDITKYSKNYFLKKHTADTTIDQNSNVQANNVATYNTERFKAHAKLNSIFLLWKQLRKLYGTFEANRLIEMEFNKTINMQDGHHSYMSYCFNFSTYDLYIQGLPFITNLPSDPPKHADTLLQHTLQMCMFASHQILGATGICDVLIVYSQLLKNDSLNKNYFVPDYINNKKEFELYVKQEFQKFVYSLNQPVRQTQSTFTNITIFDSIFLNEVKNLYIFGKDKFDSNFAMYIQKLFLDSFKEFNKIILFTFPVLTAQLKIDKNNNVEDKEFFNYICEQNLEFANINIFSTKNLTALSSCCRLQSNIEDLIQITKEENINLIGGSTLKVGSFGVVTINLPRLVYLSNKNEKEFFNILIEIANDVIKINNARRELIKNMIEKNQYPLYNYNFMNLNTQYSTIGLCGIFETVSLMGLNILKSNGKNFTIKLLQYLQDVVEKSIIKYEYKINLEQIPAESTASKLAKTDKLLYKQEEFEVYSNQFIPLVNETDLINRIELQSLFEKYFTGGSILHLNVAEKITSNKIMKKLIEYTIKKGVQYFAVNYFFQKCKNNHITVDDSLKCNICNDDIIEKYTRIVGFLVPVSVWQKERREEFKDRKKYKNGQLKLN